MNTGELTFKQFLFQNRHNRMILILAGIAMVVQFGVFKYFYPYANYIHDDSFVYINGAYFNWDINTHPIGYSKFMRLFSVFNRTDLAFTAFQYLLIQCSVLYLLFSIFYLYKSGKTIQYILFGIMVLNPLFLHLGNLIGNDGFFLALSCTWFALLLWIIHRPSYRVLVWHSIVLFIAFAVRYNALIYPFIAVQAFWLSKLPLRQKLWGLTLPIILCSSFIIFNMYKFKQLTGYWQFAPFSGWQIANNALYSYRFVDSVDLQPIPTKFQPLDRIVHKFYHKTRHNPFFTEGENQASTFYMWTEGLPLMAYKDSVFKNVKETANNKLKLWASIAPLYKDYGEYIIRNYPFHYVRYFMWPNSRKYFAPPVEFLGYYNSGLDTVTTRAQQWFGYRSRKVNNRIDNDGIWILDYYPILSGIINVLMLFGLLYYILLKGWKYNLIFNKTLILTSSFWLLNAGFTIISASVALRFQSFTILLSTIFALLMVDWMIQLMKTMKTSGNNIIKIKENILEEVIARQ